MAGAPANPSFLRFSTDELPERERLPAFQDVFGRAIAKVDFEPLAGTHLRIQAKVRALPGLGAAIGAFSPRELIATAMTTLLCSRARKVGALSPSAVGN